MLNKKYIERSFDNYKKWSKEYISKGKVELALDSISIACQLAHWYFLKMCDNDIEDMLFDIGKSIDQSSMYSSDLTNRFILYDSIAIDNMALTQQYLRALISWDVEFLYILNDENNAKRAKDILNEVRSYKKADLFIVPLHLSKKNKMNIIYKKIAEYMPHKAFLHLDIEDVVGVAVWNNFRMIIKYLINHADHAFWIGTGCSDYVISYSSIGLNASKTYRNIEESKLLIQPFYPIIQDVSFDGLPQVDRKYSIKLFSGGRFFKIYGEKGQFMEMTAHILKENPEVVMFFAGSGNERPLKEFIKKHQLENRWIVMNYRRDLVEVLKHIDIYIGTYPLNGGLMANYAAYCGKPILERAGMDGSVIEDIFPKLTNQIPVTFRNIDDYYEEANKLIKDENYRKWKGDILSKALITPEEFNNELKSLIDCNKNNFVTNAPNFNLDKMCEQSIETENNFLHMYPKIMLNNILFRRCFLHFVDYFIHYVKYNGIKKIMVKTITIIRKYILEK